MIKTDRRIANYEDIEPDLPPEALDNRAPVQIDEVAGSNFSPDFRPTIEELLRELHVESVPLASFGVRKQ